MTQQSESLSADWHLAVLANLAYAKNSTDTWQWLIVLFYVTNLDDIIKSIL